MELIYGLALAYAEEGAIIITHRLCLGFINALKYIPNVAHMVAMIILIDYCHVIVMMSLL